jgi:hypothetical protein
VIEEYYQTLKDTGEIAQGYLKDHPLIDKVVAMYPDPAEPDDTNTLQRILRIPARSNTGGPIKDRLALIRRAMKTKPTTAPIELQKPSLFIDRSCTKLAWECREGYRWPQHKSEAKNDSENPMDKDNHGPEALGRFFKGYFGVIDTEERRGSRQKKARVKR